MLAEIYRVLPFKAIRGILQFRCVPTKQRHHGINAQTSVGIFLRYMLCALWVAQEARVGKRLQFGSTSLGVVAR